MKLRLYSMTKPIICTAFMIFCEQGRFQLGDRVAKLKPAFGELKVLEGDAAGETKTIDIVRAVTIRDLLTHSAGLIYDFWRIRR